MSKIIVLVSLLIVWGSAMADPVLNVAMHSKELDKITELGQVNIEGLGKVQLTASRNNAQVVVKATGPGQDVLGRAETTIGLTETPVYVRTPGGLRKITVIWGVEK